MEGGHDLRYAFNIADGRESSRGGEQAFAFASTCSREERERGGRGMERGREGGRENGLAGFPFETTKQSPRVGEVAAAIIIHTRIAWSM